MTQDAVDAVDAVDPEFVSANVDLCGHQFADMHLEAPSSGNQGWFWLHLKRRIFLNPKLILHVHEATC